MATKKFYENYDHIVTPTSKNVVLEYKGDYSVYFGITVDISGKNATKYSSYYENVSVRSGDDLFIGEKKLSVSIATKSITSSLIHFGLNIDAEGAPVNAADLLKDVGVTDVKEFAIEIMQKYSDEVEDICLAACKVRGVI